MKKYFKFLFVVALVIFTSNASKTQALTLNDLEQIQSNKIEMIRNFLINKGWIFYSAENGVSDILDFNLPYDKIGCHFKKKNNNEEWLYVLYKDGFENIVVYELNRKAFSKLEKRVRSYLTTSDTKVLEGKLITSYLDSKGKVYHFIELTEDYFSNSKVTKYSLIISDHQSFIQSLEQRGEKHINTFSEGAGSGIFDGTGDGIFGRQPVSGSIRPELIELKINGKITFRVCIDRLGENTFAGIIDSETTIKAKRLQKLALISISKYEWEEDFSAAKEQCGKYTYIFKY